MRGEGTLQHRLGQADERARVHRRAEDEDVAGVEALAALIVRHLGVEIY